MKFNCLPYGQAIILFGNFDKKFQKGVQNTMPTIKEYAKEAKARMKNGFWDDVNIQRQNDVAIAANQGKSTDVIMNEYREVLKRKIFETETKEDELLYRKVCALLSQKRVIINPIGELADKSKMKNMSEAAKQHYVFELSKKFKQMKERYFRETEISCKS